jgi:hypothetical protein
LSILISLAIGCGFLQQFKFISSECISQNASIKSFVIENVSKLERIETKAFNKTTVEFVRVPGSVAFLGQLCFSS